MELTVEEMKKALDKAIMLLEKSFYRAKEPLASEIFKFIQWYNTQTKHP